MILAPVIALDPTAAQEEHFRKACGVARLAYNGALAQWKRQYEAGERPSAYKLKIKWNETRLWPGLCLMSRFRRNPQAA